LAEIELIKKENEKLQKENNNNRDIIKNLIKELDNFKKSSNN
jgi:predicted RNase H-like nuclease (RuvC/YqgF family)